MGAHPCSPLACTATQTASGEAQCCLAGITDTNDATSSTHGQVATASLHLILTSCSGSPHSVLPQVSTVKRRRQLSRHARLQWQHATAHGVPARQPGHHVHAAQRIQRRRRASGPKQVEGGAGQAQSGVFAAELQLLLCQARVQEVTGMLWASERARP